MRGRKPTSNNMKNSPQSRSAGPLVSLLVPTYNQAQYLGSALDSALAQTYRNLEIIVHDDASTDNTPEVLALYSDPRLRIIRTEDNHGMIGGWNYLVGKARGKYLKFLASDDLLAPTCVAELVKSALSHPTAALITCQRQFIDEQGRVVKKMGFADKSVVVNGKEHAKWILTTLRENKIGEPTAVLYPARLVKTAGGYDPQFSQFADFEYWLRLFQFGDLVYIHQPLCSFRLHPGSNTSHAIRDGRFITETFALIHKYYSPRHPADKEPFFVKTFALTPADRKRVVRQKTLDILKNIKDLLVQGKLSQSFKYFLQLVRSYSN